MQTFFVISLDILNIKSISLHPLNSNEGLIR